MWFPLAWFALAGAAAPPRWAASAQTQVPPPPRTQEPTKVAEPPAQLKVTSELVRVDVTVTDTHGKFVADLRRDNFRVLDDGASQPISYFASVDAPAQVLVVVETSPAVYLIHRQHLEAAYALLDGLAADDWVALATYDQSLRVALPFTQDKAALAHALLGLHYNLGMGGLNLFDALASVLDSLAPLPGKRAVVLLSTGLDTSAPSRWDALLAKLRASEVTIYPIALGGKLREFKGKVGGSVEAGSELSFAKANQALATLAETTGGQAFFPTEKTDFVKLYRQLAAALRHVYTLGFAPPASDGRYHSLQVQVFDDKGQLLTPASVGAKSRYRISARPGYLATAP